MMLFMNGILQEKPDRYVTSELLEQIQVLGQEKMDAFDDYSPWQKECKCGRKRRG